MDADIRGDQVSFNVVPIDLRTIGDFIEEGFEKASHGCGRSWLSSPSLIGIVLGFYVDLLTHVDEERDLDD